jgi:hypothetical protein
MKAILIAVALLFSLIAGTFMTAPVAYACEAGDPSCNP